MENGRMLQRQIILLRGKRIEAMGSDIKIPAGAKISSVGRDRREIPRFARN